MYRLSVTLEARSYTIVCETFADLSDQIDAALTTPGFTRYVVAGA